MSAPVSNADLSPELGGWFDNTEELLRHGDGLDYFDGVQELARFCTDRFLTARSRLGQGATYDWSLYHKVSTLANELALDSGYPAAVEALSLLCCLAIDVEDEVHSSQVRRSLGAGIAKAIDRIRLDQLEHGRQVQRL